MKLYLTNQHPDAEGKWAVVDSDTGKIHATFDADEESKAIGLLAEEDPISGEGAAWEGPLGFVDTEASDRRMIMGEGMTFRDTPLPLMRQTETAWGHDGAVIAGRIDTVRIEGSEILGTGVFDVGEEGTEAARMVNDEILNGVSMDLSVSKVDFEVREVDEDGWPIDWLDIVIESEFMGATITPFPAFAGARIRLLGESTDDAVAASGRINPEPPVEWFSDPELTEPTPLTVTEDGRIFGHFALWGECHIGHSNTCVVAPRSQAEYSYFTTGAVTCEGGCHIPTGAITLDTGHADLGLNYRQAAAHYDNTGTGIADVAVGEDQFGPWVAGAVRTSATDDEIRILRASSLSGDWRSIKGGLELVAILAVNVPGFPVPRARVASGEETALVAAVAPRREPHEQLREQLRSKSVDPQVRAMVTTLQAEIAQIKKVMRPLLPLAATQLDERVHRS